MLKLICDVVLRPNFYVACAILSVLSIIFFNIPFFTINNNDETFSALDISLSTAYIFSILYALFNCNIFIVNSFSNRLFINLIVKPFGIILYVLSLNIAVFLISAIFHFISLMISCYFFNVESSGVSIYKLCFFYSISFILSTLHSLFVIPLSILIRNHNALILNIMLVFSFNLSRSCFPFNFSAYTLGDSLYNGSHFGGSYVAVLLINFSLLLGILTLITTRLIARIEA